jgi:5'-methylthioadenosine phosphorylase
MNLFGHDTINAKTKKPKIAIIGGSGLCTFSGLPVLERVLPETKYGKPSDEILICDCEGEMIAFVPRHGAKHAIPPHKVPYKANLAALKSLGVEYVIGTCIVGSLKKEIPPGSLVVLDQFVNLTWGRDDSFEADGAFMHLPMGEPYCNTLRTALLTTAHEKNIAVVSKGTAAVIQGPRFSTVAESQWLSRNGWDVVNMTQYPECYFARELGLCYAAIAAVTDYDVGLQEKLVIDSHTMNAILPIFWDNIKKTKKFVCSFVQTQAKTLSCSCASNVLKAYYEQS